MGRTTTTHNFTTTGVPVRIIHKAFSSSEVIYVCRCARMFSRLRRVVRPLAPLAVAVQSTHLDPHMVHAFSSAKANLSNLPLEGTYVQTTSAFSIAANDPLEDRFSLAKLREDKVLAAVMDGHGGWQCANFVQNNLYEAVAAELTHSTNADDPHEVGAALTRAFERVDRDFLGRIRPAFQIGFGRVSNVGACAIAAIVTHSHIIVANAGDCRAVFGRTVAARESSLANATGSDSDSTTNSNAVAVFGGSAGAWIETTALSYDHNSRLPREQAHLRIAHPDEPDLVVEKGSGACYVKGRCVSFALRGRGGRLYGWHNCCGVCPMQSAANACIWGCVPQAVRIQRPSCIRLGSAHPTALHPALHHRLVVLTIHADPVPVNCCTSFLGQPTAAKPEIRVLPLHNGATGYSVAEGLRKSFLILACDGVWDGACVIYCYNYVNPRRLPSHCAQCFRTRMRCGSLRKTRGHGSPSQSGSPSACSKQRLRQRASVWRMCGPCRWVERGGPFMMTSQVGGAVRFIDSSDWTCCMLFFLPLVVVLFVGPKSPAEGAPVGTSVSISGGLLAALKRAIGL